MVIQSDAYLCEGVSIGGSWTPQKLLMHINRLQFLAADLALKSFLKDQQGVTVLLQLDNYTAVAYIKNLCGGNRPHSSNESTVALGTGKRHLNHSPRHPRSVQYCGRLQIQGTGQTGYSLLRYSRRYSGTSRDQSICLTTDLLTLTTSVLQLEARSLSSGSGCLSTGLESVERVCQSPMVPGGTDIEQGGIRSGSDSSCSSSTESSVMVSSPTHDAEARPLSPQEAQMQRGDN